MSDSITRHHVIAALAEIDTGTDMDHFIIPVQKANALANLLEPEFRRRMSLAWHQGANKGIKWAQGDASQPLTSPYEEQE